MRTAALRRLLVLLLCLMPLITLVHINDVGRWEMNRCAMAAPDELSYLLMAKSIATHGTIATTALAGRDTFYPPGYPAILALWGKAFGFSIESMHVCTVLLLCAAAGVGYLLVQKVLAKAAGAGGVARADRAAVLILALFVLNWHVLDAAMFVFSEPAFMLATFSWMLLGLTWPQWYRCWWQTLALALLAAAAISIRGAGLICFATMLLYPLAGLALHWRKIRGQRAMGPRLACIAVVVAVAMAYQVALFCVSPEKSLAVGQQSENSYTKQLLHGLSDGWRLDIRRPKDWRPLAENAGKLLAIHCDDFSESLVPLFRDDFPRSGLYNLIGKLLLAMGLAGWMWRCVEKKPEGGSQKPEDSGPPATHFLEWYVALYVGLYLIWPFSMQRFWTPILPVMLAYVVIAIREFGSRNGKCKIENSKTAAAPVGRSSERQPLFLFSIFHFLFHPRRLTLALLALLLVLYAEEIVVQLPHYQRRLNYVSDALADGARRIAKLSPDPAHTVVCVMNGDDHFVFAWYLPLAWGGAGPLPSSPLSHARREKDGSLQDERFETLLTRKLTAALADPRTRVFAISYFNHADLRGAIANVQKDSPVLLKHFTPRRVFQKNIEVEVWEFLPVNPAKESS